MALNSRKMKTNCRWHGIFWLKSVVDIQLHTPRWNFGGGDYYVMAPTVIRLRTKGDYDKNDNQKPRWSAGIVILGFGVAVSEPLK